MQFIDRHLLIVTCVVFAAVWIASALISSTSFTLAKPLDWLESWLKLFQTVLSIVIGLKVVANIQPIIDALPRVDPSTSRKH